MENETPFERWWLSLPLDLRQMYGSQGIGPAQAAWDAQTKRIADLERENLKLNQLHGATAYTVQVEKERDVALAALKHMAFTAASYPFARKAPAFMPGMDSAATAGHQ